MSCFPIVKKGKVLTERLRRHVKGQSQKNSRVGRGGEGEERRIDMPTCGKKKKKEGEK